MFRERRRGVRRGSLSGRRRPGGPPGLECDSDFGRSQASVPIGVQTPKNLGTIRLVHSDHTITVLIRLGEAFLPPGGLGQSPFILCPTTRGENHQTRNQNRTNRANSCGERTLVDSIKH